MQFNRSCYPQLLWCAIVSMTGLAQSAPMAYPSKPVRMIIAFAPGGGTDIVGRIIGQKLSDMWPAPVVIDNRAGAGSTLGTEIVARSVPDGYTLQMVSMSHALNVFLYKNLAYDPVNDFATICMVARAPNVLVVHPAVSAQTVKELVALTKARPGQLNFSSSGNGGVSHLSAELFRRVAGINITHIPYKGAGPAMTALLSGEVQIMMATTPVATTQMKANRVRALALSSAKRSPLMPGLPTIAESGYPGFEADTWYGMLAPRGTPAELIKRINHDINRLLELTEVITLFEQQGAQPAGDTPEEFRAFIRAEVQKWAKVMKSAGVDPI